MPSGSSALSCQSFHLLADLIGEVAQHLLWSGHNSLDPQARVALDREDRTGSGPHSHFQDLGNVPDLRAERRDGVPDSGVAFCGAEDDPVLPDRFLLQSSSLPRTALRRRTAGSGLSSPMSWLSGI